MRVIHPQHLPTYKYDFFKSSWETKEAGIYEFHYIPGSLAEKEIVKIIKTQLDSYKK